MYAVGELVGEDVGAVGQLVGMTVGEPGAAVGALVGGAVNKTTRHAMCTITKSS